MKVVLSYDRGESKRIFSDIANEFHYGGVSGRSESTGVIVCVY
ncbi:MAG TPA: hypothetical protein PKK43_03690 [Spirochaetota bacterium]|nr:hypothetical protein [Spirochaetota bacterium]